MGNQSDGQLLILLIIPVLWLLWLWVHSILPLVPTSLRLLTLLTFVDDRVKTNHRRTFIPNVLQLDRNDMLCSCGQFSG